MMVYGYVPSVLDGTERTINDEAYASLEIPDEYTYMPYMSDILNQGSESTCVPHSISAIYDYYNAMKNPDESENGKFTHVPIAIHEIYRARTNRGEGMSFKEALEFCKTKGVLSDENYRKKNVNGHRYKIMDYAKITSLEAMKRSLIINGPCVIATYVKDPQRSDFWNGRGNYGGHATSIIGYNDNKAAFLLRNSWGTRWGAGGYTWIPYKDFNKILEAWTVLA